VSGFAFGEDQQLPPDRIWHWVLVVPSSFPRRFSFHRRPPRGAPLKLISKLCHV
jgi:hypothetical protein